MEKLCTDDNLSGKEETFVSLLVRVLLGIICSLELVIRGDYVQTFIINGTNASFSLSIFFTCRSDLKLSHELKNFVLC